jgi:hypothetical protein
MTLLLVPAVVAGLVYLISSAVSDVMIRFCVAPLSLRKVAASLNARARTAK